MIKKLIFENFGIEVVDFQLIKPIGTLVFKLTDINGTQFSLKLYQIHQAELVKKIPYSYTFLDFVRNETGLGVQQLFSKSIPLLDWENEKRFFVLWSWIDGEIPVTINEILIKEMAILMAKLHNSAISFEPKLDLLHIDNQLILNVKKLILKKKKYFEFDNEMLDWAFGFIEKTIEKTGFEKQNFGLIHSDLHFLNVIQNGSSLLPIDFDELAYGHYWLDIAIIFNELESLENGELLKNIFFQNYTKELNLDIEIDSLIADFQPIAGCIYLNWLLAEGNESLLENDKILNYGKYSLDKILGF